MPNIDPLQEAEKLKGAKLTSDDEEAVNERIKYVKIWLDKFATEEVKFKVTDKLPEGVKNLSKEQKELLKELALEVGSSTSAEELQDKIYQIGQGFGFGGKEIFQAVYVSLLGKDHGPKAGWLVSSLETDFVKKRFEEAAGE
jgi:lysyl-tRNA synthetase class 1